MSRAPDEADKHYAGTLPADPKQGARPVNDAAKRKAEDEVRVYTQREILEGAYQRATSSERPDFCTTGHYDLDQRTGGIRGVHGWVFIAETNWGKTAWLVSVADENLRAGKRVLIVTVEDDESIFGDRLLTRRARLNADRVRNHELQLDERQRAADVVTEAPADPVLLDGRGKKTGRILAEVSRLIKQHKINLVAYDYLQRFKPDKNYQDERVKFREIATQLNDCAKDHGIPNILCSQITPSSDGKRYPDKYSIRESKDVANAAEFILVGMTAASQLKMASGRTIPPGARVIKIDKGKDARKGLVQMLWNDEGAYFEKVTRYTQFGAPATQQELSD